MSNSDLTKEAIANAFKEILQEYPFSKVSVKLITARCNISRNTFYYHFKDKYELINWIFYSDMLKNVNSFTDPSKLTSCFVNVCKCLYNNRKFYFSCFQYVGQNSLYECLYNFYYELWKINIDMHYSSASVKLSEQEIDIMARLRAHSIVGIISDWVKDGMHNNYMNYLNEVQSVLELEETGYSLLCEQKLMESNHNVLPYNKVEKKCKKTC